MTTKKNLFTVLLILFIVSKSIGQNDPYNRIKQMATDMTLESNLQYKKLVLNPDRPLFKPIAKPPIPFIAFKLVDKNQNPIDPNKQITLPNGKVVNAKEWIDDLNTVEQRLNAYGHSLRTEKKEVVSEIVHRKEFYEDAIKKYPQKIGPKLEDRMLEKFISPELKINNVVFKAGKVYTPEERKQIDMYKYIVEDNTIKAMPVSPDSKPNKSIKVVHIVNIGAQKTNGAQRSTGTQKINNNNGTLAGKSSGFYPLGAASVKMLQKVDKHEEATWSLGDPDYINAGLWGTYDIHGKYYLEAANKSEFNLHCAGSVFGSVLGNRFDVLKGELSTSEKKNGSEKATNFTLYLFDNAIFSGNEPVTYSDTWSKRLHKPLFKGSIPLAYGFFLDGEIGLQGFAGVDYGYTLDQNSINGFVRPTAKFGAYASVELDFVKTLGAGVRYNLNFVQGSLDLGCYAGIVFENTDHTEIYANYGANFGYDVHLLNGDLTFYIEACIPGTLGLFDGITCIEKDYPFYDLPGFNDNGSYKLETKYFLASITP